MTEIPTQTQLAVPKKELFQSLEPVDRETLEQIATSIKSQAEKDGIEVHLLVVGSTVDTEKRKRPRKDIDLVVYSPHLAVDVDHSTGKLKNWDKFIGFLERALAPFGGEIEEHLPFEIGTTPLRFGGVLRFIPREGKMIDFIPTYEASLSGSFGEYLKAENRPFTVLL